MCIRDRLYNTRADGFLASPMDYPYNPNGSDGGIAGLRSGDGRHLAMMPHPERTVLDWQCAWHPEEYKWLPSSPWATTSTPWMRMFHNAYLWSTQ